MPVPFPTNHSKRHTFADERLASLFLMVALLILIAVLLALGVFSSGGEMINYESYMRV